MPALAIGGRAFQGAEGVLSELGGTGAAFRARADGTKKGAFSLGYIEPEPGPPV